VHASKLVDCGFEVIITGTKEEGEKMRSIVDVSRNGVYDTTGRFKLEELVALIGQCDALVAASTGPLHIAAASGTLAIGLYSPKRPIHPGRWAPLGIRTVVLTAEKHPMKGQKLDIKPDEVLKALILALN
jgi:ADP-heptose:LPS heptosyltransferase